MEIEIRDITPEEAAPYGENADIVLTGRKAVVFTDADGNVGRLYMKEEDNAGVQQSLRRMVPEGVMERIQERPAEKSTEDHRRRVRL